MKKCLLLLTFIVLLAGCGQKDVSIEFPRLSTTKDFNSLGIYVRLENHTTERVNVEVDLELEDHWLNEKLGEKGTIKKNGVKMLDEEEIILKPETDNSLRFSYEFIDSVNRFELKRDLYYHPIQLKVTSNGEVIATESISEIRVIDLSNYRNSDNAAGKFIFLLLAIVGATVLIEKGIRKWLGVEKTKKEDQPKWYRWLNLASHLVLNFLPILWLSKSFDIMLILYVVIIAFTFQVILELILLKDTREYQVTIVNGAIFILLLSLFIQYLPYIMYR